MHRIAALTVVLTLSGSAFGAGTPEQRCEAGKKQAAGKYADCRAKADAKLVTSGDMTAHSKALLTCQTKLTDKLAKLEQSAVNAGTTCPTTGDATAIDNYVAACTDGVNAATMVGGSFPDCAAEECAPGCAANQPPTVEQVFATEHSVKVGDEVAVGVCAADTEGDPLTYQWTESVPGFGFFDPAQGFTTWKAGPRGIDQNQLTITVRDSRGGTVSHTMAMDFDGIARGPGTCATPTEVAVGDHVRGFTVGGTSAHGSNDCEVTGAAPEHVFRLDVATRQDISITTAGSAFFARLYVRKDACGSGPDACDQFTQRIDLPQAEPGAYYIFVDGDSVSSQGEFQLTVFSGTQPEDCSNFADDDGDAAVDCADSDCSGHQGCLECTFDCDPSPSDCLGGECDHFAGRCNTFVRFGESCDRDGNPQTPDVCNDDGQCVADSAVCGNGVIENGEQCDDGNLLDGDGCSATCESQPICGNFVTEPSEECDDGNTVPGDGCDSTCRVERCGEATCDDSNPCTADVCLDPMTSFCDSSPVSDGTPCDLDGSPATSETCQAGTCVPPIPE